MSDLKEGDCILCESVFSGHFGHPRIVTKVSGHRVYWKRPRYRQEVLEDWDEGSCHIESVMYTALSFEEGIHAWNAQHEAGKVRDAKKKEAEAEFHRTFTSNPNLTRHERKKVKT